MNKQQLYALHSLAGINLSILICFILITGTLAVVSHEIDWLTNPSKRVLPAIDSSKINWSLIYQAANKQSPNDLISSINAPIDDWFAVEVIRIDKNEQRYFQFYHPVTAKYKGSGRWYNWQRLFRMLHRHLMMPTIVGVTIVGMVGLLMFFSLISGFFLIPQWWNKFFVKPRTNNRKVFWNDCHRLFGLWSSWLLLILCITGTWYLLELWGLNAKFPEQKESITISKNQAIVMPSQDILDHIISNVAHYHDMEIKQIILPSQRRNAVIIQGQNGTALVRDRANNVLFHPISGEFLSNRFAQKQSIHVRWCVLCIYTKILYFLFGTVLSALAISGTYLYGLRKAKLHRNEFKQVKKSWQAAYRGMSFGKWISLCIISVSIVLAVILFNQIVFI